MEDRVGSNNPQLKDVQKLTEELRALRQRAEKFTISLTVDERRHLTKFRPGGESIVAVIGTLAAKQELKLPKISVQGMKDDMDLAAMLAPLQTEISMLQQRIDDTIVEAHSECWWATTAYYAALVRMSAADPDLAEALKPAIEFFATGKRRGAPLAPKAPVT
jgi:hypothetical protein